MDADLLAMIQAIRDAFEGPLIRALSNVDSIATPLLMASVPLVVGLAAMRAAVGAHMPVGALVNSFLVLGVSIAAINFWPQVVDLTSQQISAVGGMAGSPMTGPFETASAGAGLATRAFEHGNSAYGLFSDPGMMILFLVTGVVVFLAYLRIAAYSLVAWIEFYGAAVVLSPLIALLPVSGVNSAGYVPFSFMIASSMRIVGLSLVASFGNALISNPQFGIPTTGEEVTYLNAFVALGMAVILLYVSGQVNAFLVGNVLQGRPGWSGGISSIGSQISGTASQLRGGGGGGGRVSGAGGAGGGGSVSGGSVGGAGLQSTSTPVTGRARP